MFVQVMRLMALRQLKPGIGHMEHIEIDWAPRCMGDGPFPAAAAPLQEWWDYMRHASKLAGKQIDYPSNAEELVMRAGFVDINHQIIRVPLRSNAKDDRDDQLSRWFTAIMCYPDDNGHPSQAFDGLSMSLFTRHLGQPPDYVRSMCKALRKICASNRLPLFHNMYV